MESAKWHHEGRVKQNMGTWGYGDEYDELQKGGLETYLRISVISLSQWTCSYGSIYEQRSNLV